MIICYLGVGTNLGNRRENITLALRKIKKLKGTRLAKVSKTYRTRPQGGPKHAGYFLNAAAKIETGLSPQELLRSLKNIERDMGRKKAPRFWPRIMDLDILFFGGRRIRSKALIVPHPRIFSRDFVKKPLADIIW